MYNNKLLTSDKKTNSLMGIKTLYKLTKSCWRRLGLLIFSSGWMILAISYFNLREQEIYLPDFWPVWFAITSILTIAFMIKPESFLLYKWAGAFSVVGLASRSAAIMARYFGNLSTITDLSLMNRWSAIVAIILYGLSSFLMWRFWIKEVGPWHRRHKSSNLLEGD